MSRGYSSLIEASIDLDFSELESRLDDLEGKDVDEAVQNALDNSDFESRISSLESLNTCGVDVNTLGGLPDDVAWLKTIVGKQADQIAALEGKVDEQFNEDGVTLASLAERLDTQVRINQALQERIERLEYTSNVSYNFFALAGKMVSLLLNGPRS